MLRKYGISLSLLASLTLPHGAPARAAGAEAPVPVPVASVAPAPAPQLAWGLRLPEQEQVAFKGVANFDQAGGQPAPMMYPAFGVAGFLAGVITHGVIVNAISNGKKTAIEEAADKVLLPYQEVLGAYKHSELMQQALAKTLVGQEKKLLASGEQLGSGWVVESVPVFSMTQDQSALVLDNTVVIYQPGNGAQAHYQNTVRVVSRAKEQADLPAFWTAAQGRQLKEECARLMAMSLDIGLGQAQQGGSPGNAPFKTFRYLEGKNPMMERAQLVGEQCGRSLVKNLRGWLMSIPVGSAQPGEPCAGAEGPG